ncbi:MAG: hypothetical protein KAR35_10030, partial [Candidatus Heimdallarchaeota archaeon]|nr:hypothetical protein [Candidatus Heimdallarchaeota archaeon]MCK5049694.1 hypothetical protein [Candidatus Heimdallarchaeota archaeon]
MTQEHPFHGKADDDLKAARMHIEQLKEQLQQWQLSVKTHREALDERDEMIKERDLAIQMLNKKVEELATQIEEFISKLDQTNVKHQKEKEEMINQNNAQEDELQAEILALTQYSELLETEVEKITDQKTIVADALTLVLLNRLDPKNKDYTEAFNLLYNALEIEGSLIQKILVLFKVNEGTVTTEELQEKLGENSDLEVGLRQLLDQEIIAQFGSKTLCLKKSPSEQYVPVENWSSLTVPQVLNNLEELMYLGLQVEEIQKGIEALRDIFVEAGMGSPSITTSFRELTDKLKSNILSPKDLEEKIAEWREKIPKEEPKAVAEPEPKPVAVSSEPKGQAVKLVSAPPKEEVEVTKSEAEAFGIDETDEKEEPAAPEEEVTPVEKPVEVEVREVFSTSSWEGLILGDLFDELEKFMTLDHTIDEQIDAIEYFRDQLFENQNTPTGFTRIIREISMGIRGSNVEKSFIIGKIRDWRKELGLSTNLALPDDTPQFLKQESVSAPTMGTTLSSSKKEEVLDLDSVEDWGQMTKEDVFKHAISSCTKAETKEDLMSEIDKIRDYFIDNGLTTPTLTR